MKNIGLVTLSLILSLFIGLTLSSSTSTTDKTSESKKTVIGFSMDTLQEARWKKDRDIFVENAESLGAEVIVTSANSDDKQQIKDVETLITKKVDVIVIIPHDGKAMAKAVEMAHAAGIPVIAYDRLITESDLDLYITFDNEKVGETQAQYLVDSLPKGKKSKIVRIYGAPTDNNAKLFKSGQDRVIDKAVKDGLVEVVHEDWAENWAPGNAKKIMNAAISKNGTDIQGVLASNDGTAGGAVQVLKEEKIAGQVIVTGQDADLVAVQRIIGGQQHMTVYKPIKNIAASAAQLAHKLANGKPVIARSAIANGKIDVPSVLLEVTVVDKNNIEETIVKDGFHSKKDLGLE
ncbi:MAG: substrate-binding domain-containing protein [Lentisphaeraceae bacterium]|nr:substrate-binding domain-containing protein [Lentisphaeraceae bacterium]